MVKFDDVTIERLFGSEDAENENSQRFKEYFYFNRTYENLRADLPIRILVGHKGIGKSALLRRAFLENEDENQLAVWIRPNDLVPKVGESNESELNRLIENWKRGLLDSVYDKAIERLYDTSSDGFTGSISRLAFSSVVDAIKEQLRKYAPETVDAAKKRDIEQF